MKKKKITIKPFLNTYLDPVGSESNGKKTKDIYSLYYKVTYNRKNTQLKSFYGIGYSSLEDSIAKKIIGFESKILSSVLEYEIGMSADEEYQLSGLKKKYEVYVLSVLGVLDTYLRKKLWNAAAKTKGPWHVAINFKTPSAAINVLDLYSICKKLFSDFDSLINETFKDELECFKIYHKLYFDKSLEYDFATLIDWKNQKHTKELELELSKIYKNNTRQVSKTIKLIDNILNERLKNITEE